MANLNNNDYRTARQASGPLLFALVGILLLLDAFRPDFEVNPLVLVPILLTGAALFAVDVPGLAGLNGLFRRDDEDKK